VRVRVKARVGMRVCAGLVSVEMQLSDEPPLGDWTIKATFRGQQQSRSFTVKEYG